MKVTKIINVKCKLKVSVKLPLFPKIRLTYSTGTKNLGYLEGAKLM